MEQPAGMPETRRDIELLTSIRSVESDGTTTTKCFGNILELGLDAMVVESHRIQNTGASLELSVVFPGQPTRRNKVAKFYCVVRTVRDRNRLHYDLVIERMSDGSRERLIEYLSAPSRKGMVRWA